MQRNIDTSDTYALISQRIPLLKGWAIIWIVAFHLVGNTRGYLDLGEAMTALSQGGLKEAVNTGLELAIAAGNTGVNLFLVISGFGLTASWWKRYGSKGIETMPIREFWTKRVFRIFPLFWLSIVLSVLLYFIRPGWAPFGQDIWQQGSLAAIGALLATVTTIRNFIPEYYYFLNGAWWYIGLSLQLYLIFPILIKRGQQWGWQNLLMLSLLFSLAYRAVFSLAPIEAAWMTAAFAFFPARLFAFVLGVYLAIASLTPSANSPQPRLHTYINALLLHPNYLPINIACFTVGLTFKWINNPICNIFSEALITLGLFCGLICLGQLKLPNIQQFQAVKKLTAQANTHLLTPIIGKTVGKYSYGIYLTHMNVYLVLWPTATKIIPSYWPRVFIVVVGCLFVGTSIELSFSWLQSQLRSRKIA
ncbi:MAG: acyltransferase [Cyanobacteria bacterium J06627_28]